MTWPLALVWPVELTPSGIVPPAGSKVIVYVMLGVCAGVHCA